MQKGCREIDWFRLQHTANDHHRSKWPIENDTYDVRRIVTY